jgi:hypothetical protein
LSCCERLLEPADTFDSRIPEIRQLRVANQLSRIVEQCIPEAGPNWLRLWRTHLENPHRRVAGVVIGIRRCLREYAIVILVEPMRFTIRRDNDAPVENIKAFLERMQHRH